MTPFARLAAAAALSLAAVCSWADSPQQEPQPMQASQCLMCHGSLAALTALEPKFDSGSGKINPHRFVPHDSTAPENFPECTSCHTQHPMPPPKGYRDSSANVEYCYSCHHSYTFEKCGACHK